MNMRPAAPAAWILVLMAPALFTAVMVLAQTPGRLPWTAPAEASAKQNPLKGRPELAAGGKKVFARVCAGCHGPGPGRKAPDLSEAAVQQESDGAIFWKISTGNSHSGMPVYSSLPEAQRWQLVLYIRTQARNSPE